MKNLPFIFLVLSISIVSKAQQDSLPISPVSGEINPDIIEDFIQNQAADVAFDFNTIFEQLDAFRKNPINLNKATTEDLEELNLLTELQIVQFFKYRQRAGHLIAIQELQAVPGFDLKTIRMILPFVRVGGHVDDFQIPVNEMLVKGTNELFFRWGKVLETQKGFVPLEEGQTGNRFLGDPNKLYIRFRHNYDTRLRFGFTAEKDAGEEFFKASNQKGFDFYSAHLFVKDYNQKIKALALGDFSASFGQGLILYSGFGRGKGSQVMNIKRNRRALTAYASADENNFLRGAGTTIRLNENLELTAFASIRKRDANILQPDTLDSEEALIRFSSLQNSGLHRTPNEIADEDELQQTTFGGQIKFKKENGQLALNILHDRFDKTLKRKISPYNQFFFNGQQLTNISLDYSYIFRNINFFGETARSSNGAVATTNGLLMTLDRHIDFGVLYRNFPKNYHALNARPVAESSGAINENGLYLATIIRMNRFWKLAAYFDMWKHPWLSFNADAPSKGHEYRARLSYYLKRKLDAYLEFRTQVSEINAADSEAVIDYLVPSRLSQARLHLSSKITKAIELRSRIDFGFYDNGFSKNLQTGFLVYQDIIYKPLSFPLSFTTRFALFDTDGYAVRFYEYENDLLYSFSIPAYYNKGRRFYLNLRYKGIQNLTLELRYAQTYWANKKYFGSGLTKINGPSRSEVKAQVKYRF